MDSLSMIYSNATDIIYKTQAHIKSLMLGEVTGHDWWHIHRVHQMAKFIAENENANSFIVEMAALLHDIADWKFNNGDDTLSSNLAREWMEGFDLKSSCIEHVCEIINCISFKGAGVPSSMRTIEGKIVQDADRMDAVGAIGIARAFAYGGFKKQEIYDPEFTPKLHESFEEYKFSKTTTINHFHEKLILLEELMNTDFGKKIASQRSKYMRDYLDRFLLEWKGEDYQ
jgi:uncharacterized protein